MDPERFLQWLYPKFRWVYSPAGVVGAAALMLAALTLVVVNFDEIGSQPELTRFRSFFNMHNMLWLWLALALAKVIHELGHGLTCTHFGGECHEMGVLFLVFSPCLYCNVTDAWMLPHKWHRIAISAAGIYVEVVLAAVATFLWWYTEPGLVHSLAFSTLIVCSVSTVFFNANPLMRFDGYYILSDLLEIPNLRAKSTKLVQRCFARLCLGIELPSDPFMPETRRWLFVLYAVSAYVYRWLITAAILMFLYTFLKPYKLGAIGAVLAYLVVFMLVVVPLIQFGRFLSVARKNMAVKKSRPLATGVVLTALVVGVLFVPIPRRIRAVLTIEPPNARPVFVRVPGTVKRVHIEPGQKVGPGKTLIELTNYELQLETEQLRRQVELHEAAVNTYWALNRPGRMQQSQHALAETRSQMESRKREQADLTIKSPRSGIIIPPPVVSRELTLNANDALPGWDGSPLDRSNLGSYLSYGTLVCLVGDPARMEAVLVIDQSDVEFVRPGQSVELKLDAYPNRVFDGTIEELAYRQLESSPPQLSTRAGGELPTKSDATGRERPLRSCYQARVKLKQDAELLQPGFRGRAKIHAGKQTCAEWLTRSASELFRFRL